MGRNVEIKARLADLPALARRVAAIADDGPTVLLQEDTFFPSPRGRLKLRRFESGDGELIYYRRPDATEPEESSYVLSPAADPESLAAALGGALGVRGVVRKKRTLYRVGRTRVHLDEVEGLGDFLELEVVLAPGEGKEAGLAVARELADRLGIAAGDLVARAYIDLLEEGAG